MPRLALDYVSPLPPVRSGIADYSTDLLPHLEPLCDLRVVRVPGQEVGPEVMARWSPVDAGLLGRDGRLPLFHMGNNRYHEAVLELALESPGVVVLHDLVLHHLLVERTLGKEAVLEPYQEKLAAEHGWIGAAAAESRRWCELGQAAMFELAAHRSLLESQRGVLVHSRWAAALLAREHPDIAVRHVPMAMPLPAPLDRAAGHAMRERLGIPLAAPLLGSFGFQTPIKRTDIVVEALSRPELEEAHLLIAGELSPALDVAGKARELGITDRVHVTGFLPFEDLEAAIAACDLCANLRYPTAGETSASLLRVLAVGRAAVVSNYAQFAELADAAVLKVPLGEGEVDALATAVGELLADRDRLTSMGEAARETVRREHAPDRAAKRVIEACTELAQLEPAGPAEPWEKPPSSLIWLDLPGTMTIAGWEAQWPTGARKELTVELANTGFSRWLASDKAPGGVVVVVQWRTEPGGETLHEEWLHLPTDLDPGQERHLTLLTRRPLGARALIIEPHVKGVSGVHELGGPRQILVVDPEA